MQRDRHARKHALQKAGIVVLLKFTALVLLFFSLCVSANKLINELTNKMIVSIVFGPSCSYDDVYYWLRCRMCRLQFILVICTNAKYTKLLLLVCAIYEVDGHVDTWVVRNSVVKFRETFLS